MSWWAEKIKAEMPQAPPAPRYENIAPGAWWQGQDRPANNTVPATRMPLQSGPQPAQSTPPEDLCPRCGGDNYVEMRPSAEFGGGMTAMTKRCFDCRYPMFDASGEIIRGVGVAGQQRRDTRQLGGGKAGSWQGAATWDNAVLVA